MDVELIVVGDQVRGWHAVLAEALAGSGASVRVSPVHEGHTWSGATRALLRRERRWHRLAPRGSATVASEQLPALTTGRHLRGVEDADIRLDLTGGSTRAGCWRITYDGEADEDAAVRSLLAGRFPVVRVVDADGRVLVEGRPGSEVPGVVTAALDDVLAGCVQLALTAVAGRSARLPDEAEEPDGPNAGHAPARTPAQAWRRSLASVPARRAYHLLYRSPHWRVGWRWVDGPGLLERAELPERPELGWHRLPDDGHHFYADPFPILVEGRAWVFVEDFDHRVGRGVISVVELDEDGPRDTPRPVLASPVHLSYPAVLEDDGCVWMIPETSGAHRVELYRATAFPDDWTLDTVLLDGLDANDVTPFRHGGRWWLSATVRHGGSCSDALHLWHADRLRGPWLPHDRNPVLVDISSARPAGRLELHGTRLLRPAQDGSRRYGGGLAVTEVVELTTETFAQRVVGRVGPGPTWPGHCLHTVNRAGRLEVVDGSARSSRLRSGTRP